MVDFAYASVTANQYKIVPEKSTPLIVDKRGVPIKIKQFMIQATDNTLACVRYVIFVDGPSRKRSNMAVAIEPMAMRGSIIEIPIDEICLPACPWKMHYRNKKYLKPPWFTGQ